MGNWDVSKPNNDGERELLDRAVKALETEFATKTCNKKIASKLEDAELARDSKETCNNKQVISKLVASEDCISRADAEALFRTARSKLNPSDYKTADEFNTRDLMLLNAEQMIHLLPSVTPKQKTGRWIYGEDNLGRDGWYCNQCGHFEFWNYSLDMQSAKLNLPNPCPNCLAKMQEVEENGDK